jgi:glycolate oxidase iron-sulfur subunit
MQTNLTEAFLATPQGREAESILRTCVHCGFCTATCPTYQLLGDELDGPRGRIYLMKQLLEGQEVTTKTQGHLDRCLTCRSCETTCPSGVSYGRLIDIGRELVEERVQRPALLRIKRTLLRKVLPFPKRFSALLGLGRAVRPLLPKPLANKIPPRQQGMTFTLVPSATRTMLVLDGCAQSSATPNTNQAAANLLGKFGIRLISAPDAGCCGAVSQHLAAADEAQTFIRRNIDAWWPYVHKGAEAVIVSASGCGVMVKDYGHLLADDPDYAEKAARISELAKDLSEVVRTLDLSRINIEGLPKKIAFHSPCTLQHGQQLSGVVEEILTRAGFELLPVADSHLCCGSAGTYSILQPELSRKLLSNKLESLQSRQPELITTANIGCQLHLGTEARVPVLHWVELLGGPSI